MNRWLFLVRGTELFHFHTVNCFSRGLVKCTFSTGSGGMSAGNSSGKELDKFEILWRDLLSDPSHWWDNRAGKPNPRFPDFKHKQSGEALWLIDGRNPPWVVSEIASIAPGLSIFSVPEKLARYNKAGQYEKSLELFEQTQKEGITIDGYISVRVLNACAALQRLKKGTRIHEQMIKAGRELNLHENSSLVDMYAKCGSIDDAWRVFTKMPQRDVVCWNAMIQGLVKCDQGVRALELFQNMQQDGVQPNSVTFLGLLNACASIKEFEEGKRIHRHIIRSGLEGDEYVANTLVDMYAKCGSITDAWRVFNKMHTPDVIAWNALILGFVKCGQGHQALELFKKMHLERVQPDSVTFVGVLNACACTVQIEEGRRIHEYIIQSGWDCDVYVHSSLVDMYAKCGSIEDAWRVFDKMPKRDVVCWNALILGFLKCGQGLKAVELFEEMLLEGVKPNAFTFVGVLTACASVAALETGKRIHKQIIDGGLPLDLYMSTSLVDMYAKCGSMADAWRVFKNMTKRDVVCWNALILGFLKYGQGLKALELYEGMQLEGIKPDSFTFVVVLNACASVAALEIGKLIHRQVIDTGLELDLYVSTSLVDMYAKCGSLNEAAKLFVKVPRTDVATWNVMIMGYAMHGRAKEAVSLFEQMFRSGSEVDEVTFICVLSACSHGGLVKEGTQYFDSMTSVYGVTPTLEHYTCMVDLLGRAGRLDDAEEMVKTMPLEPCAAVWMALLGACKIHGNVEMGERASRGVLEMDHTNAAGYVLLSNIYAAAGDDQS